MSSMIVTSILLLLLVTDARCLSSHHQANQSSNDQPRELESKLTTDTFLSVYLRDEIYSEKNLERLMLYIHDLDKLEDDQEVINDTLKYLALGRVQTAIYNSQLMHRYDTFRDLKLAGGPEVNQDLCLRQVEEIIYRYSTARSGAPHDMNIRLLMDTFGRVPAGVRGGHLTWTGRYLDCENFKLTYGGDHKKQDMRYCLASMKNPNWTSVGEVDEVLVIETGVCLPRSCESLEYKEKYKLVERLIHLNDQEFVVRGLNVTNLYCLPDEKSELRQWWRSSTTTIFIGATTLWLCIIVLSTLVHHYNEKRKEYDSALPGCNDKQTPSTASKIFSALSINENMKVLLSTASPIPEHKTDANIPIENQRLQMDLRSIDGIKVICMFYVILGHTLTCFSLLLKNAQDHFVSTSLANFIPYLVPIFAVNGFFVISGLLTSYIIFRENRSNSFLNKPSNWFFLVVYRYLRVMPMYLIVALFTKHLGRYIGSGPFWDYGTSSLAPRLMCEREPIGWVLLFGANFKLIFDHCVVPAWYLANDFQFFLVTPIFISLLHRSPKIGRYFILFCIALCCAANTVTMMMYDVDFRPIVQFATQSLMYQSSYMNIVYTNPFFRIPSYLMGIIIGYELYLFAEAKLKFETSEVKDKQHANQESYKWSPSFARYGPVLGIAMILMHCILPVLSSRIPFSKLSAKLFVAGMMPIGHLMFAWSIGSYVLLVATGYGIKSLNKLLTLSVWKPLARLSLCTLLIQMEVIQYFVQTTTEMSDFNAQSFASLTIFCAIFAYLTAAILYVVFEAPIRNLLSIFISHVTSLQQASNQQQELK